MVASTQLERIAELVERLTPLGDKHRGMRIEADEWNALIAGLLGILEIDRSQERTAESSLADNFARKVHEHLGDISSDWLDADLLDRLGDGGGGISIRGLAAQLERRVSSLGDEVARLSTRDEEQQQRLDRATANELEQSRALRGFEERFSALETLRTVVGQMTSQVAALSKNVDTVLELRRVLTTPEGTPIDLASLRKDVTELQALRVALLGVDGKLLPIRELELKIADLEDVVGIGGSLPLEDRISTSVSVAEERINIRLEDLTATVRTELLETTLTNTESLRNELQASIGTSEATLVQQGTTEAAAAEVRTNTRVDQRVAAASAAIRQELTSTATATIDSRLAGLPAQIGQAVNAARVNLEVSLRGSLTESLAAVIGSGVAEAEARLGQQVGAAETSVNSLAQSLPGMVDARIETARAGLQTSVDQRVAQQVAQLQLSLDANLSQRITAATTASFDGLRQQVDVLIQQRTAELTSLVNSALQSTLSRVSEQVGEAVRAEIVGLNLDGQLDRLSGTLISQFRSELDRAVTGLRSEISTRDVDTTRLLRSEISAAQKAATEEAVVRSAQQQTQLRDELGRTIDTRVAGVQTVLERRIDARTALQGGTVTRPITPPR